MVKKNKKKEFVYEINLNADGDKLLASKSVYVPNEKGKLKLGVEARSATPAIPCAGQDHKGGYHW